MLLICNITNFDIIRIFILNLNLHMLTKTQLNDSSESLTFSAVIRTYLLWEPHIYPIALLSYIPVPCVYHRNP